MLLSFLRDTSLLFLEKAQSVHKDNVYFVCKTYRKVYLFFNIQLKNAF